MKPWMIEHFKVASTILILGMNMWDLRRKDGEWLHRWWDEALSPSYDLQTLIISYHHVDSGDD